MSNKTKQHFLNSLQRSQNEEALQETKRQIQVTIVEKSELSSLKLYRCAYEKRGNVLFMADPKSLLSRKQDQLSNLTKRKEKLEQDLGILSK